VYLKKIKKTLLQTCHNCWHKSCGLTIWVSTIVVKVWNIHVYVTSLPSYKEHFVSPVCLPVGHMICCCRDQWCHLLCSI